MLAPWLIEILRCPETGLQFDFPHNVLVRWDGKIFQLSKLSGDGLPLDPSASFSER